MLPLSVRVSVCTCVRPLSKFGVRSITFERLNSNLVCWYIISKHRSSSIWVTIHLQGCQQTWKVREIWYFFKVRELSGNFENWSVKNKNPQMSGKSQGKIILKGNFFLLLLHVLSMAVFLHWIFNWKIFNMIIFHTCKMKQTF